MSNPKTAINEIKKLMVQFGFMSEGSVMASFKLEDNTILQASKLEVGNNIVKINEEFEQVKLEDGSYRLVENFNIDVKDGKIVAVKEIFVEAKLEDGTVVKVEGDGLVEGAKVLVVTPDAEIPAPDGVHKLSDGTEIETKDGMIVTIKEVVSEGMEDVEIPVEVPAEVAPVAQEVVDAIVEAIIPVIEEVKILVDEMKKMKQGMKDMSNDFASFKSEPAGKKIRDGKTEQFNKEELNQMDAKLAAINSLRFSNKK
jgi:hypothetical protein